MLDFLRSIALRKTKVLRPLQAMIAIASMVGAMILARGSSNAAFSKEVLKTIATAMPTTLDAVEKKSHA